MASIEPIRARPWRDLRRDTLVLVVCSGVVFGMVSFFRRPAEIAANPAPPTPASQPSDAAIARARSSTVALEYGPIGTDGRRRMATGVMIDDDGHVLSVRIDPPATPETDPSPILARDASGHRHRAGWLAADLVTGLTLLRVTAADVKPIGPAVREPSVGSEIFLVGTPYGMVQSVSRGHVAGLGRHMTMGDQTLGGLIQLQASIHPGDSGALLADTEGGWLGLIRGVLIRREPTSKSDDDDLGFAIPARDALWIAGQLIAHGKVDRAYLGVHFDADQLLEGAVIAEVVPDSPAYRAGLQPNDRITRLDNRPIRGQDDLADHLDRTPAGTEIVLEFARGDRSTEKVSVRSASRPTTPDPTAKPKALFAGPPPDPARVSVPREVLERFERIERRLEELERRDKPLITP